MLPSKQNASERKWLIIHLERNNQLDANGIPGRERERRQCCLSPKYKPCQSNWKQPGSDLTIQKLVCLFLTQFELYCWTMAHAACTWWRYNGVAGKQKGVGSVWEGREVEWRTDMRGMVDSKRGGWWKATKESGTENVYKGVRYYIPWRNWCSGNCWCR